MSQIAEENIQKKAEEHGVSEFLIGIAGYDITKEVSRQEYQRKLAENPSKTESFKFSPDSPGSPVSVAKSMKQTADKIQALQDMEDDAEEAYDIYRR